MPTFTGIYGLKQYLGDYLNYYLTMTTEQYGIGTTLSILVAGIITIFLLKNLCDYLAMFFITFLRNGILRDMRNACIKKRSNYPWLSFPKNAKATRFRELLAM
jgi:subfamily B ATP-binding cassette protein MsbA